MLPTPPHVLPADLARSDTVEQAQDLAAMEVVLPAWRASTALEEETLALFSSAALSGLAAPKPGDGRGRES